MTTTLPAATAAPVRTLSIVSLALGAASLVFGFTFFVPLAGVIVGVLGYRQEREARALSVWGIVLSALAVFGWVLVAILGLAAVGPWLLFGLL
jgi:hypothetical protein